jgi:hypothetical protein
VCVFGGEFSPFSEHKKGLSNTNENFFIVKNTILPIFSCKRLELYNGFLDL